MRIGLFTNHPIYVQLISELLNHQGIIFELIDQTARPENKYPCIIMVGGGENNTKWKQSHNIQDENNIIELDVNYLDKIFNLLCGIDDTQYLTDTLYEPIVSIYESELVEKIKRIYHDQDLPFVQKWFWPNFASSCCVITHDVDSLNYPPKIGKNITEWVKYINYRLIKKRAYGNNIPDIVEEERERDIRSSFYFFSHYGKFQYDFIKLIEILKKTESEIGLHGSLHSFQSPHLLEQEKEELENLTRTKINGERQHTLNFLVPHTWRYQDNVGFNYDLTSSYNDKFGFRNGTCHPYHPIDIFTHKTFNLLEIPTSFMDWTALFQKNSLNEQENVLLKLEKIVEKYNGCLVLNFHNMYINKKHYPDIFKLYISTLDYVKQNNYWIATAKECAQWWEKREKAKLHIHIMKNILYGESDTSLPLYMEQSNGERYYVTIRDKIEIMLNNKS